MLKKMFILGLIMSCLSFSTYVFAEDVVVTAHGSKYHKPECRLVKGKDNTTTMSKEKAMEAGYEPCGRCYKEDKVTEQKDSNEK